MITRSFRIAALAAMVVAVAFAAGPGAVVRGATPARAVSRGPVVRPAVTGNVSAHGYTSPLSTSDCLSQIGIACYTPLQYRVAYDLNPLYGKGIVGKGRTIVIVDSYGSPTITSDLHAFDQQFGFPDPVLEIRKFGNVPPFDSGDGTMVGWATETTLDVEYAHSIAPGAKIVLVETAVAETEGTTGLPQMMGAEDHLIKNGVGDVITQSFGATENTFSGFSHGNFDGIMNLRYAFQDAQAAGVTVLASSGDDGATDYKSDGSSLYAKRVNSWPSSDPLVTSVGGTLLSLDNSGNRVSPDVVWNDGYGAGGGGESGVFSRPSFQDGVAGVVGAQRGTPDISMSAAVSGAAWVYWTFGGSPGWHLIGGTSEASPIFSGIVAMADQKAHHRLGDINPALYAMGAAGSGTGLVDVTSGNNSYAGVTGFNATTGYDMASGWGTIDGAAFVKALAAH